MRANALLRLVFVAMLLVAGATDARAQGKGPGKVPPGQANKHVTPDAAVIVSRQVLVKQGYQILRVEQVGTTQVVYYRRGNMGRGRGHGAVEHMVVRPSGTVVVFETTPAPILAEIRIRLGL